MSTRGWSAVIDNTGAGGGVPVAGDYDIYLDVAVGNDLNGGTGWADAFLTWERAMNAAELQLATDPQTEIVTIFVDNSTGAVLAPRGFTIAPDLPDRVRLNVVNPTDRWTQLNVGTVGAAGITAEAGDSLANVVIVGFVVAAIDRGKTLRLTRPPADPNVGEILCATIVAADVVTNSYTISTLNADLPAFWDADALTISELMEADSVLNGALVFSPKCGGQAEATLVFHKNWLFGVRANTIILSGDEVAAAACECRTRASTIPDGSLVDGSGTGSVMRYITGVLGGIRAGLSDLRAQAWGIFGTTAVIGTDIGNACDALNGTGGVQSAFSGYIVAQLGAGANGVLTAERFRCERVYAAGGSRVLARYFRVAGDAVNECITAEQNGTYVEYGDGYIEELAQGAQQGIALSNDGAMIVAMNANLVIATVVPASYPGRGWIADAARMDLKGGVADVQSSKIQGTLLWAVNEADFEAGDAINMVTARPGVANAPDILVDSTSRMTFDGDILKTVPNTIQPTRCIVVDNLSKLVMKSGAFTHGQAPADWTNAYTLGGLLQVNHGSSARVGTISDGVVGVGGGVAITARHGSQIWWAANGTLTGAAPVTCGVKAPVAFAAVAAAVLNDLVVGAGGVSGAEELCVLGLE
jgi:hypothetical protein